MNRGQSNKQDALKNILTKKDILMLWSKTSIPHASNGRLEFFPKTIRQFNAWDMSQNSPALKTALPPIARNANDTLRNYPSTRAEVSSAIAALVFMSSQKVSKGEKLSALKQKKDDMALYITVLEHELVTLRLERADWRQELELQKNKYQSVLKEIEAIKINSEKSLAAAALECSQLRRGIAGSKGLRVIENGGD